MMLVRMMLGRVMRTSAGGGAQAAGEQDGGRCADEAGARRAARRESVAGAALVSDMPHQHHLPRRQLTSQRAIARCCRHDWEPRPPQPLGQVLREAQRATEMLLAAPAVVRHCLARGSMAPDPWDLHTYAATLARQLREQAEGRRQWVAATLHRHADQLDAAADQLWLTMIQRDY